ncbi:MAG: hypothetical protein FWG92_03560 [Leptospirales bacterium]|nr:hypothetical protein [Leptospirales bacterium]
MVKMKFTALLYVLFLACLFLSCYSEKEDKPEAPMSLNAAPIAASLIYEETARFLAGKPLDASSSLYEKASNDFYKKYAAEISEGWRKFQSPNLEKMRLWWKDHAVKRSEKNILYPFSGPDIMNVLAFFPDGDTYTLFGLEPPGAIPDPHSMNEKQISDGFNKIRQSLNSILRMNFFHTKHMAVDLGTDSFNGITGLIMLFLVQEGYTVSDVRKVTVSDEGDLVAFDVTGKHPVHGVEISFRKGNGKLQIVRYFMVNVLDYFLETKTPNFIPYIAKGEPYCTFLKSASYLMHNPARYSKIRTAVLTLSSSVVQDDSGIPFRSFLPEEWDVALHGVYTKPIKLFEKLAQPDLRKAMKEKSSGVLPFSYGYNHRQEQSNLLIAEKKQPF